MTERPVRVCLLLGRYPPDFTGWGIQYQQLLPHLPRHGVEARVLTRQPPGEVSWSSADAGPVDRILPSGGGPLARLARVWRVRAHLRRHGRELDVLHASLPEAEFYLNVASAKRLGLRVLHEMVLLGGDDPLAIRGGRFGAAKLRLLRPLDAWVGIAQAFRSRVSQAGLPEERFHCVYPGVDVERYRPLEPEARRALRAALQIPPDARVAVSVGALLPRKGMDRLLQAWAGLRPRPGRHLLLLVGPASEEEGLRGPYVVHARTLQRRAEEPDLAGTVRFVGRVDDVERYVSASDVFVLLSRREGFGIVFAEAMAAGLPCIASPLDGIAREIVDEGATGFVIDAPDEPEAVAAKLGLLLERSETRLRMGAAAASAARERFSLEKRAASLAALYRRLTAEAS